MRAASNYILSCIETGSSLGIVQFNTNATALSPMIEINTEADRQKLIQALPRQADGKTSIGAGLEKGLQVGTWGVGVCVCVCVRASVCVCA